MIRSSVANPGSRCRGAGQPTSGQHPRNIPIDPRKAIEPGSQGHLVERVRHAYTLTPHAADADLAHQHWRVQVVFP
ncbi:MAG: hypothetical protein ACREJ0_08815 [Geminicoccaceae bacterium]